MAESARYCYEDFDAVDPKAAKKHLRPVILKPLRAAKERLAGLVDWSKIAIAEAIDDVADEFELSLPRR